MIVPLVTKIVLICENDMASRKKSNKKPGKGWRIAIRLILAFIVALALGICVAAVNANIIRILRAEVVIPDLPAAFDGVTVLYATDIDLCGINRAEKAGALFEQLQAFKPDILILGGDYTSSSLLEILNRPENRSADPSEKLKQRERFFHYIASFDAPLGKFAISSPEDPDPSNLKIVMEECGIRPLFNDLTEIRSGGDTLRIVGISEQNANLNAIGGHFYNDDCVLVVAYSPTVLPVLLTSEARDGGAWSDLMLCGHTHGGQIRLFGQCALSLDEREQRFLSGWHTDSGNPILVSQGVGCEGANLRLGSGPEIWLLTLRRT